jgi:tetratricopeptide (TPR) repeat protein
VVTSRERLDMPGEWVFRLEGLLGDAPASAPGSAAWQLFVERASRVNFEFDRERERAGLCDILALVDGMPLAIELAAAWTRLLPCTDIARDLRRGLDVLIARGEAARPDHASIRASFEHSWQLLMPREQVLLMRLSVFRGGFSRAAAEDVAEASLTALASLADKSLVRATAGGRLSLHPLLCTYAAEKLAQDAVTEASVRQRHAGFFLGLLTRQTAGATPASTGALAELDTEVDNCLAAWQFVVQSRDFALLESAVIAWAAYFELRGRMRQGHDFFATLEADIANVECPPRVRAHAAWCRATFHLRLGALAETQKRAHEALTTYKALRDSAGILRCVNTLGMACWQRGEYRNAARYFADGLRRASALKDPAGEWRFGMNLALARQSSGDLHGARVLFTQAENNARRRDDRRSLALTLNNLGNLCIALDEPDDARRHLLESVALSEESGSRLGQPFTLVNLALLDIGRREWASARRHVDRALAFVRAGADRQVEPMCLYTLARIECECGELGHAREHLGAAARISLETRNVPNMIEVALVAAHLDLRHGQAARAAEALAVVRDHPGAGDKERAEAVARLADLGIAPRRDEAAAPSVEALMSRVVANAEDAEVRETADVGQGDWRED